MTTHHPDTTGPDTTGPDTRLRAPLGFPAAPDPDWDGATLTRWHAARDVAQTLTGPSDRYGWTVSSQPIPGAWTAVTATVTAAVGVVPVTHLLTDLIGQTAACCTAVGLATALTAAGARHTLRADTANHPPHPAGHPAPARLTGQEPTMREIDQREIDQREIDVIAHDRVEVIRAAVAQIAVERHDDELAHDHEDALHIAVLRAIAAGAPDAQALAAEALKSLDLDFARWCA